MEFGEVLSKGWKIIWSHKILWLFGLLSGCSMRGSGGGSNSGFNFGNNGSNGDGPIPPFFRDLTRYFENIPAWVYILIVVVGLVLVLLGLFLGTIGRIGLVRGTIQADDGAPKLTLGELWSGSLPYFWRVFWLNVVIFVLVIVALLLLLLPGIALTALTMGLGALCLVPLICVFGLAAWLLDIVVQQAIVAIVAENLGTMDGLQRGWQVARENMGALLVMALIIAVGGGIVGFVIGIPFIAVMVPIVVGAVAETQRALTGGIIVGGVLALLYLPIALLLGAILQAYIGAVWALTFRRLTGKKAPGLMVTEVPPSASPEPPQPSLPTGAETF